MTQGDPWAQQETGYYHFRKNENAKGLEWLHKAAEANTGIMVQLAQYYLGSTRVSENPSAIPRDVEKAIALYEKAAMKGWIIGYIQLGHIYSQGDGVPKDYAKAQAWFQKGAALGDPTCKQRLEEMRLRGKITR